MEIIEILDSKTRLEIIKALSRRPFTPTDLAQKLDRTLPTITRQLKKLEDLDLITKIGEEAGKTRPHQKYALNEFAFLFEATKGEVKFSTLKLTEWIKAQLRIWSISQPEFHYYLSRLFWLIQSFRAQDPSKPENDIVSLAVFGSVAKGEARKDSDVDILILAEKNVKKLKKKYGAQMIKKPKGETKMVMAQVFTPKEFENALRSGSTFAVEIINSVVKIYDPNNLLDYLRKKYGK